MAPRQPLAPGATVLLGRPGITMPSDWWLANVMWCGVSEVLVEQSGIGGAYPHLQVFDISYVRAVGTVEELAEIRAQCQTETEELQKLVREAEERVTLARQEVYRALDAMASAGPLKPRSVMR